MTSPPLPLLVDGTLRTTDTTLTLRSPWDGATVGTAALAGAAEITLACDAAQRDAPILASQTACDRSQLLQRLRDLVARDAEALTAAIVAEAGKPVQYARGEVERAQQTLQAAAEAANQLTGDMVPLDWSPAGAGTLAFTRPMPVGPVLGISPFNFPLNLMLHKIAPAIAAGCPIVHKPASSVSGVALRFAALVAEAGALPGQVQILPMPATDAARLAAQAPFAAVSFTGSPEVGWGLKATAGHRRVTLELGGNAAAILAPDATIDTALPALVTAAFAYAGQVCISLQRLFVHRDHYAAVRQQLIALTSQVPTGDPHDLATVVGPLITAGDADRIESWIAEAVAAGATTLVPARRLNAQTLTPALVEGVPPELPLSAEEVFGPVLLLEEYDTVDEAFARVNASRYGLQASVYTHDWRIMQQAHATLEVGGVMINLPPSFRIDSMPYGGVKRSGFGREGITSAIAEYTEPRLCVIRA